MTTWTKINKATGTSWTKVAKATDTSGSQQTINPGNPIGLLLALTYATTSITPAGASMWKKITKASGTSWTKITKAT